MKVLVVQRRSHVSQTPFSRSVAARVTEPLSYLSDRHVLTWIQKDEKAVSPSDLVTIDAVIFSKHLSAESVWIAQEARSRGIRVIYDLDDWIPAFPNYSGARIDDDKLANFNRHLELADVVTVSNEVLQRHMRPLHACVVHVPNGFYVEKYARPKEHGDSHTLRIVFSNADNLKLVAFKNGFIETLNVFPETHPEAEIHFYGDPFPELEMIPRIKNMGSLPYEEHKRRLASGDYTFAIVPLGGEEDPENMFFNSCKNPFKYLEYGGLGIPAIFSRTYIFEKVVTHGVTGLLASNNEECWLEALEFLAREPATRNALARAAKADIEKNHHISVAALRFIEIITGQCHTRGRKGSYIQKVCK